MAENQTNPQLIVWIKEEGVFRLAQLKVSEDEGWYDLERNVELGNQGISPEPLSLVSSIYLGPINILEERLGNPTTNAALRMLREHRQGTVSRIVRYAEDVAKEQRVPYFGVNIVKTEKDRTWKFTTEGDWQKKIEKPVGEYKFGKKLYEPEGPLEFVLHPTAQLYVSGR